MDRSRKRGRKQPRRTTRSMAKKDAEQQETSGSDGEAQPDDAEKGKDESPAAGSSQEKMDASPSRVSGQSPSKSPEENCSICLGELQNKSFTDSCFHTFCFTCLLEWAKVRAVCPLCKQPFKSIVHNVRSFQDYDQYHLQDERTDNQEGGHRFRYRTTLTNDRWLTRQQREQERQRLLLNSHVTTRHQWSRMRQAATSHFRRQVYLQNMWVREVAAVQGRPRRYRECSAEFFRTHPACTHRLIPWLNREMNILLHNHEDHVQFVMELIIDLVQRFDITSAEFAEHIRPFTGHNTEHFIHEFYNYARSPYDMVGYDRYAIYEEGELPVHHIPSDSSSSSSDDVIEVIDVISPSEDEEDDITIELSQGDHGYSSSTIVEPDVVHIPSPCGVRRRDSDDICITTPFFSQVHNFLNSTDYLDTAHSGWDSPIPGPSNIFWSSSHMQAPAVGEIIVATATLPNQNPQNVESESVTQEDPASTAADASSDPESELEIVAIEKPWDERSPIALSSAGEEAVPDPPQSPPRTPDRFHTRLRHVSSSSSGSDDSLLHPALRRRPSDHRKDDWRSRSWSRSPSRNDRYYSHHYSKQISSFAIHHRDKKRMEQIRFKEVSHSSAHRRRRSSSTDHVSSKRVRRQSPASTYTGRHAKDSPNPRHRHQKHGHDKTRDRAYRSDSSSEEHARHKARGKQKYSHKQSSSPEARYQRSKKRREKSPQYYSSSDESDHYKGRNRNRSNRNRSSSEESSRHRSHGRSKHKSTRARESSIESDYRSRGKTNDRSSKRDNRTKGRRQDTSSRNRDSSLESMRASHRTKAKKKSTRARDSSRESSRQRAGGRSKGKKTAASRGLEKTSHSTKRSDGRSQQASSSSRSRQRHSRDRMQDRKKSGHGQDRHRYRSSSSSSDRSRSRRHKRRKASSRHYDSSSDSSYDRGKNPKPANEFMLNVRIKQERRSESVEVVRTKPPASATTTTSTTAVASSRVPAVAASASKKSKKKKVPTATLR